MLINLQNLVRLVRDEPWAKGVCADIEFWAPLAQWIEEHVVSDFLERVTRQVDEIVDIDPDLSETGILRGATRYMVEFLGAHHASVRIYDPDSEQMLSFGSYPFEEHIREKYIPLEGSIAGRVVTTGRPYLVEDILAEELYHNKEVIFRQGVRSLMAIPLEIPRFFPHERATAGVIQIYFAERSHPFNNLEIQVAKLFAKRLSFVVARKKILSLHKINEVKDEIVRQIFLTMGRRGGVKMKEAFDRVIPELAELMNLESCALFSVAPRLDKVVLEAGYPKHGYHSVGRSFPVTSEPAFELLLDLRRHASESAYDIITPSYLCVIDPQKSSLISADMKVFASVHSINSILYIPLETEGAPSHFMTFDALDRKQRYRDEEIDLFLFLGRELMKAERMERLDDALHDFKNPAIAIAGFARRLKRFMEEGRYEESKDQILRYANILMEETSRLQELALSIYQVGEEQVLSLSDVLNSRFQINAEAIREQFKQNVDLKEGPFDPDIMVRCYLMHLERVFDNLLNNATKAIPLEGGVLAVRTYADGEWACAEISNTGRLSEEDRVRILDGDSHGRGLYITHRIIRLLKGKIDIRTGMHSTTIEVRFPRHRG